MTTITRRNFVLSALLVVLLFLVGAPLVSAANAPVRLDFSKSDPDGNFVWDGSVGGDLDGALQTVLLEARPAGHILHVVFDWIVSGDCSFTARLNGTLDTETGKVTMNGTVVEGCLQGAQVHEEGQLVDAATSAFAGTIRIMPASSD